MYKKFAVAAAAVCSLANAVKFSYYDQYNFGEWCIYTAPGLIESFNSYDLDHDGKVSVADYWTGFHNEIGSKLADW